MDIRELRQCLGREQKALLSSIRSYVLLGLEHDDRRSVILRDGGMTKAQKMAHFRQLDDEIGFVVVHMFIGEMYKRLLFGDKVIKEAVHTFESIGVDHVQIGSARYSRESEYYEKGAELAQALLDSIQDEELRTIVVEHDSFHVSLHRIVDYYGKVSV